MCSMILSAIAGIFAVRLCAIDSAGISGIAFADLADSFRRDVGKYSRCFSAVGLHMPRRSSTFPKIDFDTDISKSTRRTSSDQAELLVYPGSASSRSRRK